MLLPSQDGGLYCLDATSGKLVWKYTIDNMIQCAPTVVDNRCFVAGCDQKLHIVNLDDGKAATTLDIGDPTGTTPAVSGDFAYFGTQGAKVLCVNWRKSEITWTYQHAVRKQPYQSSAAVIGDHVIVGGARTVMVACSRCQLGRRELDLSDQVGHRLFTRRRGPASVHRRWGRPTVRIGFDDRQKGFRVRGGRRRFFCISCGGRRTFGHWQQRRRLILLRSPLT